MTMFHLLKIRTSIDIFKNEKCKVTFGLEYISQSLPFILVTGLPFLTFLQVLNDIMRVVWYLFLNFFVKHVLWVLVSILKLLCDAILFDTNSI